MLGIATQRTSQQPNIPTRLTRFFTQLISETSGLALEDTLALAEAAPQLENDSELAGCIREFHALLGRFRLNATPIESLQHPLSSYDALVVYQ